METTIKLDENTLQKTVVTTIDLSPLKEELAEIEKQLVELEKEPDEIMQPDFNKIMRLDFLNRRSEELLKTLAIK
jgi:hypothetical protein